MNVFLDTAALFKRYHREEYSDELKHYLENELETTALTIAGISQIEFASVVWKKTRSNRISERINIYEANTLLQHFENDIDQYQIIDLDAKSLTAAKRLLNKCNDAGFALRSLDALQLLSAMELEDALDQFVTFDKRLIAAAEYLRLPVKNFYPPDEAEL